jgi:AGZA family xanthine/uracil permease-like MFS transporter
MIEKLFHLRDSGTDVKREIVAGCTTFMTLSYIIFVQPAVLAAAGMDANAVPLLKLVSGKGKQVHWLIYLFVVLFVVRYIWLVG